MKTLEFKNEVVAIYSNDELGYSFIECLLPSTSAEFRDSIVTYLDLIEKKNIKATIVDLRNIGALSTEDLEWMKVYFYPRKDSLKVERTAVIVGEDVFAKLTAEEIYDKDIKTNTVNQQFPSFEEAEKWISQAR